MRFVHWFVLYTFFPSIFLSDIFKTGLKNEPQCIWTRIAHDGELQWRIKRISERIDFAPNKTKKFHFKKLRLVVTTNVSWMVIPLYFSKKLSTIAFDDRYRHILSLNMWDGYNIFWSRNVFNSDNNIFSQFGVVDGVKNSGLFFYGNDLVTCVYGRLELTVDDGRTIQSVLSIELILFICHDGMCCIPEESIPGSSFCWPNYWKTFH